MTSTKPPSAIETRWMPAVLAVLSLTEGQPVQGVYVRAIPLTGFPNPSRDNAAMALHRLLDAGLARWEGQRWGRQTWFLTPAGARARDQAHGGGQEAGR